MNSAFFSFYHIIFSCLFLLIGFSSLQAQEPADTLKPAINISDSLEYLPDSTLLKSDSTQVLALDSIPSSSEFETTVVYFAEDSIISDFIEERLYLYGKAKVEYGNITLTAHEIIIEQSTNNVIARGYVDTTGRLRDKPVFQQGGEKYEADSMRYNFKTQKGIVLGIVTEQGEGYMQSERAKRVPGGGFYAAHSKYTTCNLAHPHWYINAGKIKLVPNKQVITGPFNMVIGDVPTPLGFAFGIFPFTEEKRSGIIFPVYGEAADRGFFLRNGGYYWFINDYMAMEILGEISTNGSWGLNNRFTYRKRYRFNGSSSIRYNTRIQGDEASRTIFRDFWINWTHTPIPRGKSSFSASVNFGTSQFNQRNSFDPNLQVTNNFNSSISYRTSFQIAQKTVTLGLGIRQSQNSRTDITNVTAPDFNLGVNRIYPFKKKGQSARNFIQNISTSYTLRGSVNLTNSPPSASRFPFNVANDPEANTTISDDNTDDDELPGFFEDFGSVLSNAQIGMVHTLPISTTIKILKYISLNPSFNYQETWYPKRLNYTYLNNDSVRVDTLNKFSRVYNYSMAASLTTRLYGTLLLDKKRKGKWLQGIRHTMIPTLSLSYTPNLSNQGDGVFQEVQINEEGETREVSRYLGFNPGVAVSTRETGTIGFSLQNNLEAKIRTSRDSAGTRKISLLDNFSVSGSYNLFADSLNLSNLSLNARTSIGPASLNFSGTLDPYAYVITSSDDEGNVLTQTRVNRLLIREGRGIGQLSRFNVSLSTRLTPQAFLSKAKKKAQEAKEKNSELTDLERQNLENFQQDPTQYVDFDIPWNLSLTYNVSYSKIGFFDSVVEQQMNFRGDVSLTDTWKIAFSSGYDLTRKSISFTNISVIKNLHCWEMSFQWTPFGQFQSWYFNINVKSSLLQDLKITRQRSFVDRDFQR